MQYSVRIIWWTIFACTSSFASASEGTSTSYSVTGILEKIDPQQGTILVAHEDIVGFMPAMTMEFDLRDCTDLKHVELGDKIQFRLIVEAQAAWIEGVHRIALKQNLVAPITAEFKELDHGSVAPDVELLTSKSQPITLGSLRGNAVALTFIYTRCAMPGYCRFINRNFQKAQRLLSDPQTQQNYHFLSVTLDPTYDTPARLSGFADELSEDSAHWTFATGEEKKIQPFAAAFGLISARVEKGIHHTLRTVVIDPQGMITHVFRGNTWKPEDLVAELRRAQAAVLP